MSKHFFLSKFNLIFCFRHHDIRNINVGLCMDDFGDCRDNGESDCKGQGKGSSECRLLVMHCICLLQSIQEN